MCSTYDDGGSKDPPLDEILCSVKMHVKMHHKKRDTEKESMENNSIWDVGCLFPFLISLLQVCVRVLPSSLRELD